MILILSLSFAFISALLLGYVFAPHLLRLLRFLGKTREKKISQKMDAMYLQAAEKRKAWLYVLAPVIFGAIGYIFTTGQLRLVATGAGAVLGFVAPGAYFKILVAKRKKVFYDQLIDALMMMNSSLKGGLSLIQAMEVVADEMPSPISQEFSILIGENKMGVSLEVSFERLYNRMGTPALQQFISAVLLARETGGNLPIIFNRIIATIRENRKIQQNIETLTLQAKIQGVVLSLLPVVFGVFVFHSTPDHFNIMLETPLGKNLLIAAAFLQVIGAFLIVKFSTIKEF